MLRIRTLGILLAALLGANMAFGQTLEQQLTRQLTDLGFSSIRVSTTLLGRTRIDARGSGQRREIIFNPRTGEILRDYWLIPNGASPDAHLLSSGGRSGGNSGSGSSGSGSGSGSDDADDDDSDDDDDDDKDDSDDSKKD